MPRVEQEKRAGHGERAMARQREQRGGGSHGQERSAQRRTTVLTMRPAPARERPRIAARGAT
jgi:hypothetical protein